jgi:uncharacterized protein (DUF885 family)
MRHALILAASSLLALSVAAPLHAQAPASEATAVEADAQAIDALFAAYDAAELAESPLTKAARAIRDEDYGKWNDPSDEAAERDFARLMDTAAQMRAQFDPATLPAQQALSYRLFEQLAERRASLHPFRDYGYIFDQMNGAQSRMPAFLIGTHRVANLAEAEAYVSRIDGMGALLDELTAKSRERAQKGVMPPKWVYPYVISDIGNLLDAGDGNAVLADLATKLALLDLDDATKDGRQRGRKGCMVG